MPFNLLRGLSFQNKPLSFVLLVGLLCQELKPDESHVQRGQDMSLPECVAQGEVGWERQTFVFFTFPWAATVGPCPRRIERGGFDMIRLSPPLLAHTGI